MTTSARKKKLASNAYTAAGVIQAFAWIVLIGGVVGGIAMIANDSSDDLYSDSADLRSLGLVVVIGSVLYSAIMFMVTYYVKYRVADDIHDD